MPSTTNRGFDRSGEGWTTILDMSRQNQGGLTSLASRQNRSWLCFKKKPEVGRPKLVWYTLPSDGTCTRGVSGMGLVAKRVHACIQDKRHALTDATARRGRSQVADSARYPVTGPGACMWKIRGRDALLDHAFVKS